MIDQLIAHAPMLAAFSAAAGSAVVHGYQLVVKAGGLRGVWRQFLNGPDKQP